MSKVFTKYIFIVILIVKNKEIIMIGTLTIDVTNVKKILKCCPYYDDIINSDVIYEDELSIDLIDWYKDLIFYCNGDNEEDIKVVRDIDRCMYLYINDNKYRKELRKIIDLSLSNDKIIDSILRYTSKYEDNEILYITSTRWL